MRSAQFKHVRCVDALQVFSMILIVHFECLIDCGQNLALGRQLYN